MKARLRAEARARRASLPADLRAAGSIAACRLLEGLAAWREAGTVALYAPIRAELDPSSLAISARGLDKRLVYPRVTGPGQPLEFRLGALSPGTWGIPEPSGERVQLEEIDLIVVPGLAFDDRGGRLGQGGGFYDRTLALTPAVRVGLCFDEQRIQEAPMGPHDAWMDLLVCPSGVRVAPSR
jgi:5-formyltetrahydrofolate cyclo-ligase